MARRALAQQSAAAQARVRPPSDRALRAAQRAAYRHDKKLVAPIGPRSRGVSSRAKASAQTGCLAGHTPHAAWRSQCRRPGAALKYTFVAPARTEAAPSPLRRATRQGKLFWAPPPCCQWRARAQRLCRPVRCCCTEADAGGGTLPQQLRKAAARAAALRPETLQHSATARATAESSRCGRLTRTRAAGAAQQRAQPSAAPLAQRLLLCGLGPAAAAPPRPPVRWPLARSTGAGGTAAAALAAAPRRRSRSRRAPARRRR